jgi:hypothetical protein
LREVELRTGHLGTGLCFSKQRLCLHGVGHYDLHCLFGHETHSSVLSVLSISSKSGGKNGTHCWVPEVSSIAAVSYAPVQLFEHFIGRQFRAVPQALTWLQVKQFTLLPAESFLCALDNAPWRIMETENLQISASDTTRFDRLSKQAQNIMSVIKNINSKPRKGKEPADDGNEEEMG